MLFRSEREEREETGNFYIPGLYTLLFQKQERKVQGEEENQQEEVCKEMQGSAQSDCKDADTAAFADYEKAESDIGWLLSLLWDN